MKFRLCRPEATCKAERLMIEEGGDVNDMEVVKELLRIAEERKISIAFFRGDDGHHVEFNQEEMRIAVENGIRVLPTDRA